jgi:hypothetical protein
MKCIDEQSETEWRETEEVLTLRAGEAPDGWRSVETLDGELQESELDSDEDEEMDYNHLPPPTHSPVEDIDATNEDEDNPVDLSERPPALDSASQPAAPEASIPLPEELLQLREELRKGYTCPPYPPSEDNLISSRYSNLSRSEKWSLKHYICWKKTGGTVEAYKLHATLLSEAIGAEILSLYNIRKLACQLVDLKTREVHMCPNSCIAYTGKYAKATSCQYQAPKAKQPCNLPRFRTLPSGNKMARKIRSLKSPYANLAMEIFERELLIILSLHFPQLKPPVQVPLSGTKQSLRAIQQHGLSKRSLQLPGSHHAKAREAFASHYQATADIEDHAYEIGIWGKLRLPNGHTIRSTLGESKSGAIISRQYQWFEVSARVFVFYNPNTDSIGKATNPLVREGAPISSPIFGEAQAFYTLKFTDEASSLYSSNTVDCIMAMYRPLENVQQDFSCISGTWSSSGVHRFLDCTRIHALVGIWQVPNSPTRKAYILREHPAFRMLSDVLHQELDTEDHVEGGDVGDGGQPA